jgi:hypothetical protein
MEEREKELLTSHNPNQAVCIRGQRISLGQPGQMGGRRS